MRSSREIGLCQDIPGNYTKNKSLFSGVNFMIAAFVGFSVAFVVGFVESLEVEAINPIAGSFVAQTSSRRGGLPFLFRWLLLLRHADKGSGSCNLSRLREVQVQCTLES